MGSSWTIRQVTDMIVELGLIDAHTAQKLNDAVLDQTLDYFGAPDHHAVVNLLNHFGIVYAIDWKNFRSACDGGLGLYRAELDSIAAASRGQLTITDVAVADLDVEDDDDDHVLRFTCNGVPQEWRILHSDDEGEEDFDAQLTFGTYISTLLPASSAQRWCNITSEAGGEPQSNVFADPAALDRLGGQFGLTFHAC